MIKLDYLINQLIMHSFLPFVLILIMVIVFLTILADKLKVAYPILLVIAGLVISFIPSLPKVRVDPDLIFLLFLPPLLFEASWAASFKEMKKWWRMIGSFAFLVVFFTAFVVAVLTNQFIPGFSIALGFVLGGIVSPPDAVSMGAITKFVQIPKSTKAVLEGESLLNDASSLIIFRFALVAVGTGQLIWREALMDFIWMVIGGVGTGLIVAWIFMVIHKKLKAEAPSDIALTLIEPYFMYLIAEEIGCSGVLAVVSGGLFLSSQRLVFLASSSRLKALNVWESFVFLLNGMVFLLIGLELPEIVEGLKEDGISLSTAIGYGVLVTIILILTRMISSYAALFFTYLFRRDVAKQMNQSKRQQIRLPLILGWTGMRGVVSLAAALSIPHYLENGEPFPFRQLILFVTFVVILLTLVVQGLTLPYFLARSGISNRMDSENEKNTRTILEMKLGLRQKVMDFLQEKEENQLIEKEVLERILKHWNKLELTQESIVLDENYKTIFLEIFSVQRKYLHELNKQPHFDEEIIRHQIYQIDLEEERIRFV